MFLADASRHTYRTYKFDVIGAFLQAEIRIRVFVKLPNIYGELFQGYASYHGKHAMLGKAIFCMPL
jgi:hypothetical protein